MRRRWFAFWLLLAVVDFSARGESAAALDFFEKKIRPILVENCYECHGEKKQKGGLRLDSRGGWMKGGDSGPAIVAGDVESSLVIKGVRYTDPDFQMPPKKKLSASQISDLETWVKAGAVDPREGIVAVGKSEVKISREHWAYQFPKRASAPNVKDAAWPLNDVDRFVLARMEAKGLKPVEVAKKEALARRAYFDLVGLPPTPEEISEFGGDSSADAFPRLVKKLMESPRFGERWGRHWLDVARFGESVTLRGFIFKEAWRYRDYVIDAFNRDLRYDQFVREQIAGDLIGGGSIAEQQRRRVATTFLMLGNTNLEEQDKKQLDMDFVDEQLDTLGKAFLAQTIGCARCHDHKFDPIPTADYYAMAGILRGSKALEHANVSAWVEMQLPVPPEEEEVFQKHESKVAALKGEVAKLKERVKKAGGAVASGPVAPVSLPGVVVDDSQAKRVGNWTHSTYSKNFVGDGYLHDGNSGKGSKTLTFAADKLAAGKYDVRLAYVPSSNRASNTAVEILHADGETTVRVNQREAPAIDGHFVSLGEFRFEANGQGYVLVSNEGTDGHVIADAVQFLPVEMKQTLVVKKNESVDDGELKWLEAELKALTNSGPKRPMVMTVKENSEATDIPIHVRGSVHNLSSVAPRGFLKVAMRDHGPKIAAKESGRRQLAEWVGSAENPLAARVMVNRVWTWLFGAGLVGSVDNFGTTGMKPTHPELLDYLAVRFVEGAWSVKRLIYEIMTSRTYQLAVAAPDASDPENHLLSRANLRRLEAECIRDAILSVSGQLDLSMGGSTIKAGTTADYSYVAMENRRSVYLPVLRNSLPELLEVFDFPDPSMVVGQRNVSAVAQQSLFLMNHPWMREQSEFAAKRLLTLKLSNEQRIGRAYRMAVGRTPTDAEMELAEKFVSGRELNEVAWAQLWQAIFASVDFRYLN